MSNPFIVLKELLLIILSISISTLVVGFVFRGICSKQVLCGLPFYSDPMKQPPSSERLLLPAMQKTLGAFILHIVMKYLVGAAVAWVL